MIVVGLAEFATGSRRSGPQLRRTDRNGLGILDEPRCLALLATADVARVAYTAAGSARVVPVNIAVVDGAVWFRVGTGGLLAAVVEAQQLALEADGIGSRTNSAWSVVVIGHAREMAQSPGRTRPDVSSWVRPDVARLVCLTPLEISGRQLNGDRAAKEPVHPADQPKVSTAAERTYRASRLCQHVWYRANPRAPVPDEAAHAPGIRTVHQNMVQQMPSAMSPQMQRLMDDVPM